MLVPCWCALERVLRTSCCAQVSQVEYALSRRFRACHQFVRWTLAMELSMAVRHSVAEGAKSRRPAVTDDGGRNRGRTRDACTCCCFASCICRPLRAFRTCFGRLRDSCLAFCFPCLSSVLVKYWARGQGLPRVLRLRAWFGR